MIIKSFRLLISALLVTLLATTPFTGTPSLQAAQATPAAPTLSEFLPDSTALYLDISTKDVNGSLEKLFSILRKADIPIPTNIFAQLDESLTEGLRMPISVEKDILSWLGDSVAIGVVVTDEMIANPYKDEAKLQPREPLGAFAASVKDNAAAKKFLTALIENFTKQGLKIDSTEITIKGKPATEYTIRLLNAKLVLADGVLFGSTDSLMADVIAGKNVLKGDTKFARTINLLPPNQGMRIWFGARLYRFQGAQNIEVFGSDPTLAGLSNTIYDLIDGIAFGLRAEGKLLAMDLVTALAPDAAEKLKAQGGQPGMLGDLLAGGLAMNTNTKPISMGLADHIPADAIGVIYSSNLAGVYNNLRGQLIAFAEIARAANPSLDTSEAQQGFERFEQGLKDGLGLDLQTDILSWLGGEFALYMTYNKTGEFALASEGQWPFESVFITNSNDPKKSQTFIDKLTDKAAEFGLKPATPGSKGVQIYTLGTQNPVRLGLGLVDNYFLVSTGTGITPAAAAVKGKQPIKAHAAWKNAVAGLPANTAALLYLDMAAINTLVVESTKTMTLEADQRTLLKLLNQFEGATAYSGLVDKTTTTASFVFITK
jgi:hypothetical protein